MRRLGIDVSVDDAIGPLDGHPIESDPPLSQYWQHLHDDGSHNRQPPELATGNTPTRKHAHGANNILPLRAAKP